MYFELKENDFINIKTGSPYRCCFCFFNIGVELFSDNEDTIEVFKEVYTNFIQEFLPDKFITCYLLNRSTFYDGPAIALDNSLYKLPKEEGVVSYAELIIFTRLFELMDECILLHAGVVSKDGNGYIILAPSGFGKTTIVLELVSRGFKFLSDEFCPIKLSDFSIEPFPRRLGLKSDNPFYKYINMRKAFYFEYEKKQFVKCDDLFPGRSGSAGKAKYLINLTDEVDDEKKCASQKFCFELMLLKENQELLDMFSQFPGIEISSSSASGFYIGYRLKVPKEKDLIKVFHNIWEKYEKDIFGVLKIKDEKPDFGRPPEIKEMGKFETITEILSNLCNRAPTGKLFKKNNGKIFPVMLEIGSFVKDIKCYKMRPGRLNEMGDIIENLAQRSLS